MSDQKHPLVRYKVLDQCFRDKYRKYGIDDLVSEVNQVLLYQYGTTVSERTIREDIKFLKEENGYNAPIETKMECHKAYYTYSDYSFSVMKLPLSDRELNLLSETLQMISRFKGLPKFEWLTESVLRFKETFHLEPEVAEIVAFSSNPALKGFEHFESLYEAILHKQVLNIRYRFYDGREEDREIHPYQLRQYNNRWFLIGKEIKKSEVFDNAVLALDRINSFVINTDMIYIDHEGMSFDEYFKDVVGVSVDIHKRKQEIILKVQKPEAFYIETKPIHHSQVKKEETEKYIIFSLQLVPNYEFETILLGHMHQCKILKPVDLRNRLCQRAKAILKNNK